MAAHRLERFPYPLAYPARMVDTARDPLERLDKATHFVEMSAITLGVLALGWCRTRGVTPDAVRDWESAVDGKGMALGKWTTMVRGVGTALAGQPADPLARSVRLAAQGTLPRLDGFIPTRNEYAHGGKPRARGDVVRAADEVAARAAAILDAAEPLQHVRFGVVRRCVAEPTPRPGRSYEVDLDEMVGFAELFPTRRLPSGRAYDLGTVVAYRAGGLDFAVELTPYCRWEVCPRCGREELFYLTKRKKHRSDHFSFATGHELRIKGVSTQPPRSTVSVLGMQPLGSRRHAAAHGWRASWADLARRTSRFLARLIDTVVAVTAATSGWLLAALTGLSLTQAALMGAAVGLAYEPVAVAFTVGTVGKRMLNIEPVSIWDGRPLGRADALRRAAFVDLQLLLPPLAIRNLAWLLWDPARQCLHDRRAATIVVSGRSRPDQKR